MAGFLGSLDLKGGDPPFGGFNSSTQYVFDVLYPSFVSGKDESIKIEISLRHIPLEKPVHNKIKHFFKDPFTGKDLIPENKILSLSLKEAVAEKLKAAITRKDPVIRDYYDLWHIAESGFDFYDKRFLSLFKKKLAEESYGGDYSNNFGLDEKSVTMLKRDIETSLIPVVRIDDQFDLDKVFKRFNRIFKERSKN